MRKRYRSAAWFEKTDKDGFIHRSWVGRGLPEGLLGERPLIGICNTWSELTPCNLHFRQIADHVKRGIWEAGGLPFEFPVMSLGETSLRPTAMLFRNLASMDVEESIRGNPIDGVVLLCGCDKTTPSLVMGAASCDVPAIVVSGGPMLNGKFCGQDLGSGTDVWRFSEDVKAGRMTPRRVHAGRGRHVPIDRHLQRDGHGVDDGRDGRGARVDPAWQRSHSGRGLTPLRAGAPCGPAHCRDGGPGCSAVENSDARGVRERHSRERRRRRIDERRHSSSGDRRTHRRQGHAQGLGRHRPRRADARGPEAFRPVPHGGVLLRGRCSRRRPRDWRSRSAESGRADREWPDDLGEQPQRIQLEQRGHPRVRQPGTGRRGHRRSRRESRAVRRRAQAVGRLGASSTSYGPRGRVREHRALQPAHCRSRSGR